MVDVVPFSEADHLTEARDRVTEAFKNKEVFDRYIQLVIDQQFAIQQVFKDLLQKRSIDTATGATLDIIGEIVGQPRELISTDLFDFFGFQGALNAGSYGDVTNPSQGSKWYDFGQAVGGNTLLDDDTYRLFIKAKILKNTTASTPEEFIAFINFIFGTASTAIVSEGDAAFTVLFGRELTQFEQVLLNYVSLAQGYPSRLIPKTVGVRINFGYFNAQNVFAFQGVPNAKGYGEIVQGSGSYGYGLGYGLGYGDSDYTTDGYYIWESTYDGEQIYDGTGVYDSVKTLVPIDTTKGGYWATLI